MTLECLTEDIDKWKWKNGNDIEIVDIIDDGEEKMHIQIICEVSLACSDVPQK